MKNRGMSFCFNQNLLCVALLAGATAADAASHVTQPATATPRVRSVVRADARGRLVRTFVVSRRPAQPRVVKSETIPVVSPDASVPDLVEAAARKYDLDPLLVHSVIEVESGYNTLAVSPKGAQGLMQLMPATARRFGVSNTFDAKENIEGGVRYLKYLTRLFPDDPRLAIAAYNAGEGAVWKYNYQIPPYRETVQYVHKVAQKYGKARRKVQESDAVQTAAAQKESPEPSGPVYSPVQYYVDSDGRLHMRTIVLNEAADVQTP